jgi:16S rRNA processing protein RimM
VSISEEFIPVGEISGAFGVRGWMKIYSFTDPRDNILRYSPLYISLKGEWVEAKVVGGQVQGKGIVMGLANVTDRDQVIALVGSKLAIKKSQLAPAEDGEFYWSDLIGLNVVNNQQEILGTVDHLLETGAHDVLVVIDDEKNERLIPFVIDDIVEQVDLDNQIIHVDWGLDY